MSTLIVLLPAQPRLTAQRADAPPPARAAGDYDYVFSADGQQMTQHGRAALASLPPAESTVVVLPPDDVAWHRITLPKAPASRLRAALGGVLEEALLEEEADLHLALAPGARAGSEVWVAAVGKPWLTSHLQALEEANHAVDRAVPSWAPSDQPAGHVYTIDPQAVPGGAHEREGLRLAWRDAAGPICLPLAGDAARHVLSGIDREQPVRWTASPPCVAAAEALSNTAVAVQTDAEFALQAAAGEWNLRQFDLVPQRRGARRARELLQRFLTAPAWRPARYGLAALIAVQLIGLNLYAWQQRAALERQKEAIVQLLRSSFPQVRAIMDPLVQMNKEVEALRATAGRAGEGDLEPMLAAANSAWPESRAPADSLRFEPGRLTLVSAGWTPQDIEGFRNRLRAAGIEVEAVPGRLTLTRARGADAAKGAS